jgi:transposase-like protein
MKGHGSKFNRKMEQAIAALLAHRTVEEAARAAGIGHNTLLRWMKRPEFKAAYREARRAAVSQAVARVQLACMPAATTIIKLMADPKESGTVRLRAAICLLQIANTIDLEDMEARLVELERSMKISHPGFS